MSARIPDAWRKQLQARADQHDRTVSREIRRLIRESLGVEEVERAA